MPSYFYPHLYLSISLQTIRIRILELTSNPNLINPDLPKPLRPLHLMVIVMPSIRIQSHTEAKLAIIIQKRRRNVELLMDLRAVDPSLKLAGRIRFPSDLERHAIPHPAIDIVFERKLPSLLAVLPATAIALVIVRRTRLSRQQLARLHTTIQCSPAEINHGCRTPIITFRVPKVGNKLRDIEALRWIKLPSIRKSEREAVELGVAALVPVVVDVLRVVPVLVPRDEGLGYFEPSGAPIYDVGDFGFGALGFRLDVLPAGGGSMVGEFGDSVCCGEGEEPESEGEGLDEHFEETEMRYRMDFALLSYKACFG